MAGDKNGDPVTLSWSVDNPAACSFSDPDIPGPTLTCSGDGTHQVTLTADDGVNPPVSDSATVTVGTGAASDATPPVITPQVSGTLGDNDWYVSNVTVSWIVDDPESGVSSTAGCETVAITGDTAGTTLTCQATSAGGTATASLTLKRGATAPTASASASPAPNANGWNNSDVTVSFSGDDGAGSGIASCSAGAVLSGEGTGQSASGTCTDLAGNVSAPATASGINIDKNAPTAMHGGPFEVDEGSSVTLDGSASTDALSGVASIAWDVEGDGYDDGITPLFDGIDDGPYPVSLQVIDVAGNVAVADTQVTVLNVAPTIGSVTGSLAPVDIANQPVSVEVTFSEPGMADTHDVTWDWGDSNSDTQVGATSPASQGHTYATPGVYVITVTVTDDGGTATQTYEYIVIYDPEGGFVTGGGWIWSPEGAYATDPTLTGKASFGFVSKYKKGASTPTGQTEFQFKAGDLNFHSSSYEWLVVAGQDKAKYKGTGTINGAGNYGFMLTAVDNGNSGDTFRIKIWDNDNGDAVVYDNQMGTDDDSYAGTAIGGGNIKVHKAE